MHVHRLPPDQAPPRAKPFIQISKIVGIERYMVAITSGDETIVDGPFGSVNSADIGGQQVADAWGVKEVWMVMNA